MASFVEFKGWGGSPVAVNPDNVFAITPKEEYPEVTKIFTHSTKEYFNVAEDYKTVLSKLREEINIVYEKPIPIPPPPFEEQKGGNA